jgi:[NiFe] hydrogenase small subunit
VAIGLAPSFGYKVAAALMSANRPPVLWLHFAECTGCTEAVLRSVNPFFDDLILGVISLDYHETLMAGAGATVHDILTASAEKYKGQFFCVVEGSIPTAQNGIFGTVNGRTMLSVAQEICPKAKGIIAIGNCASFGGIPAAIPNPTGAKNVIAALKDLTLPPVINVPGCPPNPVSFVGVIANYLLKGTLPETDQYLRPLFAYGATVHSTCPFLLDTNPTTGRCLKPKGCKGPNTVNNCTTVKYNNATNFPMNAGHVCIGCSDPTFWDMNTPFWGFLAADTQLPPTPLEIFEKDVNPIAIRRPMRTVAPSLVRKGNDEVFDVLGRRVSSVAKNASGRRMTPGIYLDKAQSRVRKILGLQNR